jgi:hypothetical protein
MRILEELRTGNSPSVGTFDEARLKECRSKGLPQLGTTRFEPEAVVIEFIFPSPGSSAGVLEVRIPSPERIVYLAVPGWVVEQIWEGEVDGSYHFESDARARVAEFVAGLEPAENAAQFGAKQPKRRG